MYQNTKRSTKAFMSKAVRQAQSYIKGLDIVELGDVGGVGAEELFEAEDELDHEDAEQEDPEHEGHQRPEPEVGVQATATHACSIRDV